MIDIQEKIRSLTKQEIEYLIIIMLIGFMIVFSYLLYIGNQDVLQRQGNLTQAQRIKLDNALQNVTQLVPHIVNALYRLDNQSNAMLNATVRSEEAFRFLVGNFGREYVIDENRLHAQSNVSQIKLNQILQDLDETSETINYTKERTDRISRVLNNDVRSVLGSVLSLNNKINELIFNRPESNLSAQARTITNIEQLVNAVNEIRQILNQTEITAADITINQTRLPKLNNTNMTLN
jgi:hypothetical protein